MPGRRCRRHRLPWPRSAPELRCRQPVLVVTGCPHRGMRRDVIQMDCHVQALVAALHGAIHDKLDAQLRRGGIAFCAGERLGIFARNGLHLVVVEGRNNLFGDRIGKGACVTVAAQHFEGQDRNARRRGLGLGLGRRGCRPGVLPEEDARGQGHDKRRAGNGNGFGSARRRRWGLSAGLAFKRQHAVIAGARPHQLRQPLGQFLQFRSVQSSKALIQLRDASSYRYSPSARYSPAAPG